MIGKMFVVIMMDREVLNIKVGCFLLLNLVMIFWD